MRAVNPEILVWARETAGLTIEAAAKAIGLKAAFAKSGSERLALIESGKEAPTRSTLAQMAKKYHRPLLVFYLSHPPQKGDRGQDFRTFPGDQIPFIDPTLDTLIRDIMTRQRLVRSALEDDEAESLSFVGSTSPREDSIATASVIAKRLGFDRAVYRKQKSPEEAFAYLRRCIEGTGVFVLLIGDLGSHHTRISELTFRGYAIADDIAPFVVINDQDDRAAWPFTALHELTHLWLGTTGVSGASFEKSIEVFCNAVASEILLPSDEVREIGDIRAASAARALEKISKFAGGRRLSVSMVAYRCLLSDIISRQTWREISRIIEKGLRKKRKRPDGKDRDDRGPNYYVVRRHRLGPTLVGLVKRHLSEGSLTHTKAAKVLGVKPRNVEPLLYDTPPSRGA